MHVSVSAEASIDDDHEDGEIEDEDLQQSTAPANEDRELRPSAKDGASTAGRANGLSGNSQSHANRPNAPTIGADDVSKKGRCC